MNFLCSKVYKKTIPFVKSFQQSIVDNLSFYSFFVSLCGFHLHETSLTVTEDMICFPNAKINLGLLVTERRPDGYHNLETVFYPVPVRDALEIIPLTDGNDYRLKVSGQMSDTDHENNLVTKAFRLLQSHFSLAPCDVYLRKAIPSGAGLGGGSSDAAFMLKLISEVQGLNLSDTDLERYASILGSDCPFFIRNKPVFAKGTGNVFKDTTVSLNGLHMVLVKPEFNVSTVEAYSMIKPEHPEISLDELLKEPVEKWKNIIFNDFEKGVFEKFPFIKNIKQHLYEKGAVFALMTGSGSAVYGLFEQPVDLSMDFKDCFYWNGILL